MSRITVALFSCSVTRASAPEEEMATNSGWDRRKFTPGTGREHLLGKRHRGHRDAATSARFR
jgi:hypothetical protein